jgi:hypothetical protein
MQELVAEIAALKARPTRDELDRAHAETKRLTRELTTARAAHHDDTQALRAEITQLTAELAEARQGTVVTVDVSALHQGLGGVERQLAELVSQHRATTNTLITEYRMLAQRPTREEFDGLLAQIDQLNLQLAIATLRPDPPPSAPMAPSPPPAPKPPRPAPVAEPVAIAQIDFVSEAERRTVRGLAAAGNSRATIRAKTGLTMETLDLILGHRPTKAAKLGGANALA